MAFSNEGDWKKELFTKYQGTSGWALSNEVVAVIEDINLELQKGLIPTSDQLKDKFEGVSGASKELVEDIDRYITSTKGAQLQTKNLLGVQTWAASGFKGLATAAKAAAAQIKLVAAQFALFFAITEILNLIIKGFTRLKDDVIPTQNNIRTWAEDATTALKETQSELESVEDELKSIQNRIGELNNAGPLTLTKQDELRQLQLENLELEKRLAILKETARLEKAEAVEKNLDALHSFDYDNVRTVGQGTAMEYEVSMTTPEAFAYYAEQYKKWTKELAVLDEDDTNYKDKHETITGFIEKYRDAIVGLSGDIETYRVNVEDVTGEEQEYIKSLYQAENLALNIIGALSTDSLLSASLIKDEYDDFNTKLKELANTSDEITESSLKDYLGDELCGKIEAAGVDFAQLTQHALAYRDAQNAISAEPIPEFSLTDDIDNLATYEEKLDALSDACNQFADNKEVSTSALQTIAEKFADVADTPEFKQLIDDLNDTSKSSEDVRKSAEALLNIYELESDALNGVTEETRLLYIRRLELKGVANAEQVVELELAKARLANAEAGSEEEAQAYKTIDAILNESNALYRLGISAIDASDRLETIKAAEQAIEDSNFDSVLRSHGEMFLKVAAAAGMSGTYIQQYLDILANLRNAEIKADAGNTGAQRAVLEYTNQLKKIKTNVQAELKSIFDPNNQSWNPVDDGKKSSTTNSAYNEAKARLDNQLERNLISYNQYYAKLEKLGKKYFKKGSDDMNTHLATLADVRKTAYDHYQAQLDAQLAEGKLSLSEYYSKSTTLSDKWLKGRVENEKDYLDAVDSVYDQIVSRWEELISKQEEINERKTLDRTWAPGDSELKTWQKKLEQLQKDYVAGLFDNTDEYYDLYYDILKRIRDLEVEELQAQMDDLEERSEGIQDLIDMVDEMLRQRIEDQIEALENLEDKYQDIVDAKKESLDLTREELSYQRELEESNKELADLQAKAALLALDDSREGRAQYAAIMEEIRSKQLEISDSQADHTYEATTDALDEATERYQTHIQEKIDDLNEMTEHQGEWLEYVYEYIESTDPSRLFRELRDYNYEFGTGMNDTVADIQSSSADLLAAFNSNVPAILEYLKSQKNTVQATIDGASGSGSGGTNLGENYTHQIDSKLNNAIQASVTKANTDKQNRELVTQLKKDTGLNAWYDDNYKVIYIGEEGNRAVTAGAYNVIQQLKDLSENGQSREAKEKQVNTLLKKLEGKWSYRDLDVLWSGDRFSLFKTTGNNIKRQIFHNGVRAGFVGEDYKPDRKQSELWALLKAGEIVLNRNDQERLLVQMQVLEGLTNKLKKLELDSVNVNATPNITLHVEAPVVIQGNADPDAMAKLEKFGDEIADKTLTTLNDALRARGYGGRAKSNAMKKK